MSDSEKRITETARTALNFALQNAENLGQTYIGTEHMVLGILMEGSSAAATAIHRQNIRTEDYLHLIEKHIGRGTQSKLNISDLSPNMRQILHELLQISKETVDCKQILLKILGLPQSAGRQYLKEAGCDVQRLQDALRNIQNSTAQSKMPKKNRDREGILRKYSVDLSELAMEQKLDPVIGREKEMDQLLRILCRRSKNNPCLVGDAGVGKTAIVEGLAQKINAGLVPDQLKGKRILSLDMTALLAGSKFRGEFEERIQNCLAEATTQGDCILFIDEIHVLTEAGSAEGATSAANLLKPQLARGELQVIGATTWSEHKRFIEKDAALSRRFQKILVEEPDEDSAIQMLLGLMPRYELHHGVQIPEKTVRTAVQLSKRYLQDRKLPDKALDLLDEAAAKAAQEQRKQFVKLQEQLQAELSALDEEKRHYMKQNELDKAAAVSDRESEIQRRLRALRPIGSQCCEVTEEIIAQLIAEQCGVDCSSICQEEGERLLNFEKYLSSRVIGQEKAIHSVAESIRCSRSGLCDPKRPVGSFLFLGPSGVGKTELCRALAQELFGSEEAIIRLDMSEFAQEHMAARLIGAPPGYVGYQEGGRLTEAVRKKPYSLVLFDELEKAHPRICDLLLQVLEEGELKDAEGKTVSFRSCIIIMTSNIGAEKFRTSNCIGFEHLDFQQSYEKAAMLSKDELKKQFRPEFINRIDEIVVFRELDDTALREICGKILDDLQKRLQTKDMKLAVSEKAVNELCREGREQQMGARPLRRSIRRNIEYPLSQLLISGRFDMGSTIICDFDGKGFSFCAQESECSSSLTVTC